MSKQGQPIQFKLTDITTDQFALWPELYDKSNAEISISMSIEFGADKGNQGIGCFTKFDFYQENNLILTIKVGCHFTFKEEDWNKLSDDESTSIVIPKTTATHLLVLTIGTTRGVIHAKKPKAYDGIILPTFNVSDEIKTDVVILDNKDEEE